MHNRFSFTLLLAVALMASTNQHVWANDRHSKLQSALHKLDDDSRGTLKIEWNAETDTPSKLTGQLSSPSKHSPGWIARTFLNDNKVLFGLRNPDKDMNIVQIDRYSDRMQVHFQHMLFQTPVWQDWLLVEINKDGSIRKIEGNIYPHLEKKLFNRPMHPAISQKQAMERAIKATQGTLVKERGIQSYYLPYRPGTPLVYAVTLLSETLNKESVYLVHALTGRVIEQYEATATIDNKPTGSVSLVESTT